MKIIVDAMGGDYAPAVVIQGAIAAVKEYNIDVVLVGDEARINTLLKKNRYRGSNISVYPTQEVIEMREPAAASVRKKRNSSIVVGLNLVKEGKGDAFVSVGNTGAVVCAATLSLNLWTPNLFGQCGNLTYQVSAGAKVKIEIPSGSWWAYAWVAGKNGKNFTVEGSFYIGPSKTDDLLRLIIKDEVIGWVGP